MKLETNKQEAEEKYTNSEQIFEKTMKIKIDEYEKLQKDHESLCQKVNFHYLFRLNKQCSYFKFYRLMELMSILSNNMVCLLHMYQNLTIKLKELRKKFINILK